MQNDIRQESSPKVCCGSIHLVCTLPPKYRHLQRYLQDHTSTGAKLDTVGQHQSKTFHVIDPRHKLSIIRNVAVITNMYEKREIQEGRKGPTKHQAIKRARISDQIHPISFENRSKLLTARRFSIFPKSLEIGADIHILICIMINLLIDSWLYESLVVFKNTFEVDIDVAKLRDLSQFDNDISWVLVLSNFAIHICEKLWKFIRWTLINCKTIL